LGKPFFKGKAPFFLHLYKFTQDILHYPNIDWVTASEVKIKKEIYSFTGIYRTMLPSIVVSLILGLGCLVFVEGVMYVLPIIGLWLAAPLIVYATSR